MGGWSKNDMEMVKQTSISFLSGESFKSGVPKEAALPSLCVLATGQRGWQPRFCYPLLFLLGRLLGTSVPLPGSPTQAKHTKPYEQVLVFSV